MKLSCRRLLLYAFYVALGMVLTTSAILACKQCYVVEGTQKREIEECWCECRQDWRDSTGLFCLVCEHEVEVTPYDTTVTHSKEYREEHKH